MEEPKDELPVSSSSSSITRLVLNNVFGGEPAVFSLPPNYTPPISDDSNEILLIIKFLSDEFPELKTFVDKYQTDAERTTKGLDALKTLCNDFNEWSEAKLKSTTAESAAPQFVELKKATNAQIKFIMQFIYNRSVSDPEKLNQYEPFSPQVYGETSFDLIEQMLARVNYLKDSDIFVDLGSGVGNVVLHVAAATKCKRCYGFEKAEWPAYYAQRMEKEFKFWMKFFGKIHSDFRLFKADFLAEDEYVEIDEEEWPKYSKYEVPSRTRSITIESYVRDIINEANLIFVNNYVFGAELDHQLKLRFKDMLEGALIVSSKPFCPLNFRITERNLNDIGTILNVSEFEPLNGHVSWTDKPINYYFHKIDRTLLEKYFESKKNPVSGSGSNSARSKDDSHDYKYGMKHSPKSNSSSHYSSSSSRYSSSSSRSASSSDTASSNPGSPQSSTDSISSVSRIPSDQHETVNGGKPKRGRPCKDGSSVTSSKKSKNRRAKSSKKHKKSSSVSSRRAHRRHSEDAGSKAAVTTTATTTTTAMTNGSKKMSSSNVNSSGGNSSRRKNLTSSSTPQLLNKAERSALERMHSATVSSTTGSAINSTLGSDGHLAAELDCFNNRSMTKLSAENLDNKRLHDSRISSKIFKPMTNAAIALAQNGSINSHAINSSNSHSTSALVDELNDLDDLEWDEVAIRNMIGDDSMNDIDRYFENCRKQFIRYLLYVKTGYYKNKLLARLQNGNAIKKELSTKTEEAGAQYASLSKNNINLVKSKVAEMGLKDLKAPIELLEYAKTVVSERKAVEEKLSTLKPAGKISTKNETAYSDLKRLIRILDPLEATTNGSSAKRMKLDDTDEPSSPSAGVKKNGASSPSSTLKDWQKMQQEQLRGFKIPKQGTNGSSSVSAHNKLTDFSSSSPSSSSLSSSTNGSSKLSSSTTSSSNKQNNSSSNSYYHPKKNHYMMYMMENKACSQQPSPKNAETLPSTNTHQGANPISIESIP